MTILLKLLLLRERCNAIMRVTNFTWQQCVVTFYAIAKKRGRMIRFATRMRAYRHRHALFPCVSFLKRTCSHAIPYKKTDAVRNVPLETRYMYVRAAQIRRVAPIHTHALTHAYRADRSVRTEKEKRTIIPRVLRAAVFKKWRTVARQKVYRCLQTPPRTQPKNSLRLFIIGRE